MGDWLKLTAMMGLVIGVPALLIGFLSGDLTSGDAPSQSTATAAAPTPQPSSEPPTTAEPVGAQQVEPAPEPWSPAPVATSTPPSTPDFAAECRNIVADPSDERTTISGGSYAESLAAYERDDCLQQAQMQQMQWWFSQPQSVWQSYASPSPIAVLRYGGGSTVVCADGWVSSSGGKQGSCSHHGGNG